MDERTIEITEGEPLSLTDLIKSAGLTPKEFADRLGVTQDTVKDWREGRTIPRLDRFVDICIVLQVPESILFMAFGITKDKIDLIPKTIEKKTIYKVKTRKGTKEIQGIDR